MTRGWFSWKRAFGFPGTKSHFSRETGIPLTKSGRERRVQGAITSGGCLVILAMGIAMFLMIAIIIAGAL